MISALVISLMLTAADQDTLSAARDLYASAAYEDALAVLNREPDTGRPVEEARTVSQYRAFCLLALGRTAEAERAIEAMIVRDPEYHPPVNDVSPRVRTAFSEVRRRVLPGIIQRSYSDAKSAFDRKEYQVAAVGFSHVLDVIADPEAAAIVAQPAMSDLRTLASGFRDLAVSAVPPPPPPAPLPVAAPAAPTPAVALPPRIYTASDPNVVPPMTMKQDLPPFPGQLMVPRTGAIEVTIDQTGAVESAFMRQSVTQTYDNIAVKAAQAWRYMPATVDGKPVKYRKVITVTVKGRS